jgi:hypothetical protein
MIASADVAVPAAHYYLYMILNIFSSYAVD